LLSARELPSRAPTAPAALPAVSDPEAKQFDRALFSKELAEALA